MLPRSHRLTDATGFQRTIRGGRRAASRRVVVSMRSRAGVTEPGRGEQPDAPASRLGLVVSTKVGDAVTRNRVKRRLRHLVRDRLEALPPGVDLVLRALPPAATADSARLGADLDRCLREVTSPRRAPANGPARRSGTGQETSGTSGGTGSATDGARP